MRNLVFGRLGLVARIVYVLWAIAVLGWMHYYPEINMLGGFAVYIAGLAVLYPLIWIIAAFLETETYREFFERERGGSARWGGVLAFRKYGWNRIQKKPKAPIFLGKTLHKQDPWPFCRKIGVDDENHLVTIAQSRSGKSITVIWPNLVKYAYPDSVFVLDPKGEHAVLTSRHRAAQGQRVYVLDPFNETKGQVERHCFNPLAEIDPSSPRAKNDIKQIAEACVVTAVASISEGGEHFRGLATTVITGLIAHVLTKLPKERRTLPEVYTHFKALRKKEDFESFLPEMEQNPACGNAPSDAVAAYLGSPDKNRGDIFTTILNALEWVSADGMREHLSRSDFSLEELRTHRTSIYVVLDFDDMKPRVQGRYMRVLFNLALRKSYVMPLPPDREQAGRRTLFILDEVGQLEFMPSIQEAYRSHAGKNVKLWCFFQDLKALTSTFTSPNAIHGNSTSQFFGCKDAETAHFIEDHLGEYRHRRKDGDRIYETTKPLLDHSEIMDTLKQESPMQIVMTGGGYRLKLKRKIYIPGPVWKFEDSRFYAFLMRFLEFVRPFRKSIFLRITFGLVFLSAIIWFWVNYNPQNIEWYGVLVYKGVLSWFLLSIWWVVFFLPEETLKKEREERERRQREQREQYWRKTKEMREDFGLVEGFTQGQLDEQALFNLKNVAASEVKQAAWLLRKYKALCYDAVQAEEPDIFGARAYDEKIPPAPDKYTPEEDSARQAFGLPEGFTREQLDRWALITFKDDNRSEVLWEAENRYRILFPLATEYKQEPEAEELEQKLAPEAEPEPVKAGADEKSPEDVLAELKAHVDEAFKQEESQEAEARHEEQQETSPSYTPEQDAARQRFGLPVGFTWEQLKARYVEMVGDEEFSDMEKLNKDYEILLFAARDDEEDEDKDKD